MKDHPANTRPCADLRDYATSRGVTRLDEAVRAADRRNIRAGVRPQADEGNAQGLDAQLAYLLMCDYTGDAIRREIDAAAARQGQGRDEPTAYEQSNAAVIELLDRAAQLGCTNLDEAVREAMTCRATQVNNEGLEAQVRWLLADGWQVADIAMLLAVTAG